MPTCEFCGKAFPSETRLRRHHKTTSTCIVIQQRVEMKEKDAIIIRQQEEIREMRELVGRLQTSAENYRDIAVEAVHKPTTTNNFSNSNIVMNITGEHLREQVKFLSQDHIKQGAEGYAQYAVDYPLKNRVVCTDFARRKIKYKNEQGVVVQDPNMSTLSKELFMAIKDRNSDLINEYTDNFVERMKNREDSLDILTDMCDLRREVNKMANGEKSEIANTFVKSVCSKLLAGKKDIVQSPVD